MEQGVETRRQLIAHARERGIDIEATRGRERLVCEAKGEAPRGPQHVNYFLGAIGELVQRVDDPRAIYALALPDNPQYRLVDRLSLEALRRLNLHAFFVARRDREWTVEHLWWTEPTSE